MVVDIRIGHVLDKLRAMPDESVHMVWTSPPYWGLRTYGTEPQVWGGEPGCAHQFGEAQVIDHSQKMAGEDKSTLQGGKQNQRAAQFVVQSHTCRHCGAWRGEHGLEPTIDLWLQHELQIFREVWRVLRRDGTLWVNIGDAYATQVNGRSAAEQKRVGTDNRTFRDKPVNTIGGKLKPKDRLMMPGRLSIALQEDGWWLRDEIVWYKKNPMPSSVRDRTTPAHEMIYLLSRAPVYFYDDVAGEEPITESSAQRYAQPTIDQQTGGAKQDAYEAGFTGMRSRSRRPNEIIKDLAKRQPSGWDRAAGAHSVVDLNYGERQPPKNGNSEWSSRRKRSVWPLALEPYAGAHFATAPTKIVEPCVLMSTSARGVCPDCGAPWERVVVMQRTTGWRPTCSCYDAYYRTMPKARAAEKRRRRDLWPEGWWARVRARPGGTWPVVPATVLDPFGGAGTTGLVANSLGRNAILIELNPTYAGMARTRLRGALHQVTGDVEPDDYSGLPMFEGLA